MKQFRRAAHEAARNAPKNRLRFDGASRECLHTVLDALHETFTDDVVDTTMPAPSVLGRHMRDIVDTCVRMTEARVYELSYAPTTGDGGVVLTADDRQRIERAAALLLRLVVYNYDMDEELSRTTASAQSLLQSFQSGEIATGSAAAALDEAPVMFQTYCVDKRLIGESPTALLMMTRWHLLFVLYDLHGVCEGDADGASWRTVVARSLAARTVARIDDSDEDEALVGAGLCATRAVWGAWTQSDVRAQLTVLELAKPHFTRIDLFARLRALILMVEQRVAFFMLAGVTAHLMTLGNNPFARGSVAINRVAFSGGSQNGVLYTLSREFVAHASHAIAELYIFTSVHDQFETLPLDASLPLPLDDLARLADFEAAAAAAAAAASPLPADGDDGRVYVDSLESFFRRVGDDDDDDDDDDNEAAKERLEKIDEAAWLDFVPDAATPAVMNETLTCGLDQAIRFELSTLHDTAAFRARVLPTASYLELRPGEKHAFARQYNGYVLPLRPNPVLQRMRGVAQLTNFIDTVTNDARPTTQLLSPANVTVRDAATLHAFTTMCNQHSPFDWLSHVVLYERDFYIARRDLGTHLTPVICQHAACYSVLFRNKFRHCATLVEAIALTTLLIVHTLKCVFPVGLQKFDLRFMETWLQTWLRMGRIYVEHNPYGHERCEPQFDVAAMASPDTRTWFADHWRALEDDEAQQNLMADMCEGFEPVDLMHRAVAAVNAALQSEVPAMSMRS